MLTAFGVTAQDLSAKLEKIGVTADNYKYLLDVFSSGGDVENALDGLINLKDAVEDFNNVASYSNNNVINNFIKNIDDLYDSMENVAGIDRNKFIEAIAGYDIDAISDFENKIKKLTGENINLVSSIQDSSWELKLFMALFKDTKSISKAIEWSENLISLFESMKTSIVDTFGAIGSKFGELLAEGKLEALRFEDFWKNFCSNLVSTFTKAIAEMIAKWMLAQIFTGGQSATGNFLSNPNLSLFKSSMPNNIGFNNMLPQTIANSINKAASFNREIIVNLSPTINAKFDRKSMGFVVNQGNKYNSMGIL
jgi:hypothetical protein